MEQVIRIFDPDEPAMTFKEIAKELGIPTATVHWIYRQAIRKLRINATLRGLAE